MDKFMVGVLILIALLWLPFFLAAIYSWFITIELGYKIGITTVTCMIWLPIIGAWVHANR